MVPAPRQPTLFPGVAVAFRTSGRRSGSRRGQAEGVRGAEVRVREVGRVWLGHYREVGVRLEAVGVRAIPPVGRATARRHVDGVPG